MIIIQFNTSLKHIRIKIEEILECAVCEGSVASLKSLLKNNDVDAKIELMLEKSCQSIPARFYERVSNIF